MTSRFVLGALLCMSGFGGPLLWAGRARAQVPTPEAAQQRYREAHQAIARKDWVTARELLLPLWADSPTYDVASSLAQVEYQLGNYPAAATHMAFALKHVAPVEKPQTIERMQRGMAELRARVGGLKISVNPPGAEVFVDGEPVADALLGKELFVRPGPRTIEARSVGGASARQALDVLVGRTYNVELELAREPDCIAAPQVAAGRPATLPSPLSLRTRDEVEGGSRRPLWPVALGGSLTAVGIGMAIGFGVSANRAEQDWRNRQNGMSPSSCVDGTVSPASCGALREAIERQHRAATWATVGVSVSAVAALATLSYVLFWPQQRRGTAGVVNFQPGLVVKADQTELRLSGTF